MFTLTPARSHIGRSLAHRSGMAFARHSLSHPLFRLSIIKQVKSIVYDEVQSLCSEGSVQSMLQRSTSEGLEMLNWSDLVCDMRQRAPVLTAVLTAAMSRKKTEQTFATESLASCFAVLLKGRNQRMSLLQRITSLILYAGHAGKPVS